MSPDQKSAPTMIRERIYSLIIYILLWNDSSAQDVEPDKLAVVKTAAGCPRDKTLSLRFDLGDGYFNLDMERNDNINPNAQIFSPRVDRNGKSVMVMEQVPFDPNDVEYFQDPKKGAAMVSRCKKLPGESEYTRVIEGSMYIDGDEYGLGQPHTRSSRHKRQVSVVTGADGKRRTTEVYGLYKKKKRNIKKNWEMKKNVNDFKNAWNEIKKKRGQKRQQRPTSRLSKSSWAKASNKGVPVFKPQPVDQQDVNSGVDNDPLQVFNALSSRSKQKLVVDTSQEKVLGENIVNALQPTAFAIAKQRTVIATVTSEYNVGILVAIDYATYERFYKKATGATEKERDLNAKQEIRVYFSQVINGVALRYKTIKAEFSLNIVVTGFIVVDSPEYPCFTCGKVKNVFDDTLRDLTNIESALKNITEFRQKTQLPEHDHLMLFTDLDLYYSPSKNNYQTDVTGFAYVGALCTQASTSVIEDFGNFESVFTSAHELGHSLGAQHDGYGNTCDEMDQYLLTAVSGQTTETTKLNPWRFSSCSINYFRNYIANISQESSSVKNCLTDEALLYNAEEFNNIIGTHPGQTTHPNDQCKATMGPLSYYGWGGALKNFEDICTNMACNTGDGPGLFVFGIAYRGTSCGDKKWCIEGQCVYDPEAPAKKANCVHGDMLEKFSFLDKSCAQVVAETPALCYRDPYNYKCCDSCEKAADKSNPDCPYGDRADSCAKILTNPSLCYAEERECCATCSSVNTGPQGCEYGDKIESCSKTECGKDAIYREDCCETCADYVPTTPAPTVAQTTPAPTTTTPAPTTTTPAPTTTTPAPTTTTPAPTTTTPAPTTTTPAPTTPAPTTPAPTTTTEAPATEAPATAAPTTTTTTEAPTPAATTTQAVTTPSVVQLTPPTTASPPTTTQSPYKDMCVRPFVRTWYNGSYGECRAHVDNIYIPCHGFELRRRCCQECQGCSDQQACGVVNAGSCYYVNVREQCCETCSRAKQVLPDCYGDASAFCVHFVREEPEYTCTKYGPACCASCQFGSGKFSSLFARSAKNDPSVLKRRSRIDSVMKKISDPNNFIDLTKDNVVILEEQTTTTTTTTAKPPRRKFSPMNIGINSRLRQPNQRRPFIQRPNARSQLRRPATTPRPTFVNRVRQGMQNWRNRRPNARGNNRGRWPFNG